MNTKTTLINRLRPRGKTTTPPRGLLATLLLASLVGSIPAAQAAGTWDGGGGGGEFTLNTNWVGDVTPSSPYDGIIMTGTVGTTVTFAAPAAFTAATASALNFTTTGTAASFTLSGSLLTVTGVNNSTFTVRNSTAVTQTINNDIKLGTGFDAGFGSVASGGSLVLNGNIDTNGRNLGLLPFNNGIVKANGAISGSGGITVNGNTAGSILELNGTNSYTGATNLLGGTVKVSQDALLSTNGSLGNASSIVTMGGSTGGNAPALLANGAVTIARSIRLTSTGANPANTYTLGGSTAHVSTFSGTILMGTPGANLAENLTVTAVTGGRANFTGNLTRDALATGTVDVLTKTGLGIVALSGSNNYQGTTLVNAGTLLINGTLGNTGANVSVASGATLGGNGTINRSGSLAAGGILSAGDMSGATSLAGTLAFGSGGTTSGLTMLGTSVLKFDLQQSNFTVGGGVNDLVTVGGALTLDGTLQVTELGGSLTNGTYTLFTYTGALTDNTLAIDSAFLTAHAGSTIDTSVANQINLIVVPEPSTVLLTGLGLTILLHKIRRRPVGSLA